MSNSESSYYIERFSKHHLDDLAVLYEAVYGRKSNPGLFHKKYNTAYTGKEYIGYIAFSNDHVPVGYYGVLPCFLKYNDAIILSAQSADTMTHPKYRFKGLFVELSQMTFELCRTEDIRFIFGFPNQNSLHGAVNKLGWKMTHMMDGFTIHTKAFPLRKLCSRLHLGRIYQWYEGKIIAKHAVSIAGISNSVLKDGSAGVYRDENYLNWRKYHATTVIKINNSLVWLKTGNAIMIGDIDLADNDFVNVISKLNKLAKQLGIDTIHFQASPGTTLHQHFSKQYKAEPSFPVLFQDWNSDIELEKFCFVFADIDIF